MKLDIEQLRYLTREDFRVLSALEQGMKNHDVVPLELIAAISGLRSGASKVLANLTRHKLISHECGAYEGYRLTYPGFDFLALLFEHRRALGVGLVLPGLEAALGRRQCVLELGIVQVLEALQQLAVVGVDALISHEEVSLGGWCADQAARAG